MKAKIFLMLIVCLALFTQCQTPSVTVNLKLGKDNKEKKAELNLGGEIKDFVFDEDGNASIVLEEIKSPLYAVVTYKRTYKKTIYIEPGKDLTISCSTYRDFHRAASFEGENADVNQFLDTFRPTNPGISDIELNEKDYIAELKRCIAENSKRIDQTNFSGGFKKAEKERLKYYLLSWAAKYPRYYLPQNQDKGFQPDLSYYYKELKSLIVEDKELLKLEEYKAFIVNAVTTLSLKDYSGHDKYWFTLERITTKLNWCVANVNNPELLGFLVHTYVKQYVGKWGIDNAGSMIALYKGKVNNPKLKDDFQKLYDSWAKVAIGSQSPTFACQDINGKLVKLEDLRGKYVLIDIWATWCGPCCKEHPYFQKLEKEFHAKDIHFVSISTDRSKELWAKKVKKDKLGGIQLHMGHDDNFTKEYKISGIPVFILLDKEGKIINSRMPRPSDPKTKAILNSLAGI